MAISQCAAKAGLAKGTFVAGKGNYYSRLARKDVLNVHLILVNLNTYRVLQVSEPSVCVTGHQMQF